MAMMEPRWRERWLLRSGLLVLAFLAMGLAAHRGAAGGPLARPGELTALLAYAATVAGLHLVLGAMGVRGDEAVVPSVALLSGLGLLLRLRLATDTATGWWPPGMGAVLLAPLALAGAVWLCRRRLHWLEHAAWPCGLAAVGLLAYLLRHGVAFRGALYGPGLTTPSELLKPLLVVFLAGFLKCRRGLPELLAFVAIWLAVQYGLVKQSDLGLVLILSGLLLSLFYVATGRTRILLGAMALAAVVGVVVYTASPTGPVVERGQRRLTTWLRPWDAPRGAGYQALQALFAIRAGGWDGKGLGNGQPHLTPLVTSDFVYAEVAEELGLLGSGLVLLLYVTLFRRGFRIATLATDPFRQRLAVGCVTVLAIQTLVNLAGVIRLLPMTGITLPFLSHGGSSLVVCWALVGLILAVGHDVETAEPAPIRPPRAGRKSRD